MDYYIRVVFLFMFGIAVESVFVVQSDDEDFVRKIDFYFLIASVAILVIVHIVFVMFVKNAINKERKKLTMTGKELDALFKLDTNSQQTIRLSENDMKLGQRLQKIIDGSLFQINENVNQKQTETEIENDIEN